MTTGGPSGEAGGSTGAYISSLSESETGDTSKKVAVSRMNLNNVNKNNASDSEQLGSTVKTGTTPSASSSSSATAVPHPSLKTGKSPVPAPYNGVASMFAASQDRQDLVLEDAEDSYVDTQFQEALNLLKMQSDRHRQKL